MPYLTLSNNSLRIHYHDFGSENKTALVFIHGNSCSSRTWHNIHESELSKKYRIITFDLPGHGKSDHSQKPDTDYTIQGLTSCILELIAFLNISSFVLIGHSLGGHLAIEGIKRMKGCLGLMIMGTPPSRMPLPADIFIGDPEALSYNFTPSLTPDQAEKLARSRAMSLSDIKPLIEDILKTDVSFRGTLAASIGGPSGITDEISIVENLYVPIAILHGGFHEIVNIKYLESLNLPTLWKNKINIIEGSGHTIPEEKPVIFESFLSDFAKYCLR